jgi:hypothetical protein
MRDREEGQMLQGPYLAKGSAQLLNASTTFVFSGFVT